MIFAPERRTTTAAVRGVQVEKVAGFLGIPYAQPPVRRLGEMGLLRPSFVPPPEIRTLRDLTRTRL